MTTPETRCAPKHPTLRSDRMPETKGGPDNARTLPGPNAHGSPRRSDVNAMSKDTEAPGDAVDEGPVDPLVALSCWIDDSPGYVGCDRETVLWRRVTKVASEAGEAIDALAGIVGENPRKGVTHTRHDLVEELLDVAIAALGAVEHVTGNKGEARARLNDKIYRVAKRAGLMEPTERLTAWDILGTGCEPTDRPAGDA